jgi:hypothetical protein
MRIDSTQSSAGLRLIRPAESVGLPRSVKPASSVSPSASSDSYSFDAVYSRHLPRVEYGEAHRRLERIRTELVAGQVAVPIQFESGPAPSTGNPYKPQFNRFVGDPSEVNASATQRAAAE